MRRLIVVLSALLLLSANGTAWGQVQYNVIDLGNVGASGINSSGQIIGTYSSRSFLYSNGTTTDIGTLSGLNCTANGINASGQVVGYSDVSTIYGQHLGPYAFLYQDGTMTNLGTLPGGPASYAYGINDSTQIVGWGYTASQAEHAFLYSSGTMTDLGVPSGYQSSYAYAINASGEIVGQAKDASNNSTAILFNDGQMTNLGTLLGANWQGSSACGINSSGQVVGSAFNGVQTHAFLYSDGTTFDLGVLSGGDFSAASAINDAGQVVGYAYTTTRPESYAFLYENGVMTNLDDLIDPGLGWTLFDATAINNSGCIVGAGYHDGTEHAVLLTPTPEPSTFVLLGVGVSGCWATVGGGYGEELPNPKHKTMLAQSCPFLRIPPVNRTCHDGRPETVGFGKALACDYTRVSFPSLKPPRFYRQRP